MVISIEVLPGDPKAELAWQGFQHNDEGQQAEPWWPLTFTSHCTLTNMDTAPPIGIHSLHTIYPSTSSFLSTLQMTFWGTRSKASPGLWKPCRNACWQLDTPLAAAWQQRLHLLCLYLGQSQTRNPHLTATLWWVYNPLQDFHDLLYQLDCSSCPFPMHPPYPWRGRQWNCAPSQRVPCHRDWL